MEWGDWEGGDEPFTTDLELAEVTGALGVALGDLSELLLFFFAQSLDGRVGEFEKPICILGGIVWWECVFEEVEGRCLLEIDKLFAWCSRRDLRSGKSCAEECRSHHSGGKKPVGKHDGREKSLGRAAEKKGEPLVLLSLSHGTAEKLLQNHLIESSRRKKERCSSYRPTFWVINLWILVR